ncbi:MAG: phenylacetate-CoA oxygenase subunit PaaC [Phycisphaerae bacterium]|nr:phenylacetate-CoA oxygenase subunit PaaC [Phycisphaerae bacterium]
MNPAIIDLLYRLADDGLIIGHRNSEWTGLGPILEEDIAFSSVAQDKMGHALAIYNLLHELGEPAPDQLAFFRDAAEFRNCSLVALECFSETDAASTPSLRNNPTRDRLVSHGDWSLALVRQFFFSEADSVRFNALANSTFEPLAILVRKFRGEIKYHTLHGRTMMRRLPAATLEGRSRIQKAVDTLWPHALGLFEPTRYDKQLSDAGICPGESVLCEQWRSEVEPILRETGVHIPTTAAPVYGGRAGKHLTEMVSLLSDMQKVARMDPDAKW